MVHLTDFKIRIQWPIPLCVCVTFGYGSNLKGEDVTNKGIKNLIDSHTHTKKTFEKG